MRNHFGQAVLVVLLCLSGCVPALADHETAFEKNCADLTADAGKSSEHDRLGKLFDVFWKYEMVECPEWATGVGYPGQNGRWTDISLAAIERRKREVDAPIKVLTSIDRAKLDRADQL